MARRVYLATRDLLFRGKLGAVCAAAGAEVVRDAAACDLGVLELDAPGAADRLRELVERGVPVLAFGSHVHADQLRAARDAGADAVPNSQVEARLRTLLQA
jgi:CheY-like chemotaxis protein